MSDDRIHTTWVHSDRTLPSLFVRPILRFTRIEAAGGMVMLVAALVAIVWANSPWGDTYAHFWETELSLEVGSFHFHETLVELVNDGLMVLFFYVVGLEIKRELVPVSYTHLRAHETYITISDGGVCSY